MIFSYSITKIRLLWQWSLRY